MADPVTPPVSGDLPDVVRHVLEECVTAAREALGGDLRSVVLYGSAAEGRLRATSDVNLLLVLSAFDPAKADRLREPIRVAQAAIRLTVMFLLESEVVMAAAAFSEKFADVLRRRRVLWGTDPFAGLTIPRAAQIDRLRQVLLNLVLRTRETYVRRSLREEQAALAVADMAGPLRGCAAMLLELEGAPAASPKAALGQVAASLDGGSWEEALGRLSEAREQRALPAAAAGPTLLTLLALAERMLVRARALA
jgi:predicted nucleotidyltransferase